jgi:hypothetical protein
MYFPTTETEQIASLIFFAVVVAGLVMIWFSSKATGIKR